MEIAQAIERLETLHRAVLCTRRQDGSPQMSPVVCALDGDGRLVVSTRETAMKAKYLRRDPRVALCVFSDGFFGAWLQVEGTAEIVSLPEAMEGLVAYYRALSGEHPNWDEYRQAMIDEKRVLVRVTIERAGPDVQG
ncbi:MAG: PPOX class F420-dependent oxidoreductase [Acidimicrobiales bacterium]|jgi:PPOX class probable F420-dependent enzyme